MCTLWCWRSITGSSLVYLIRGGTASLRGLPCQGEKHITKRPRQGGRAGAAVDQDLTRFCGLCMGSSLKTLHTLPEAMQLHGNVVDFCQQGLEKLNLETAPCIFRLFLQEEEGRESTQSKKMNLLTHSLLICQQISHVHPNLGIVRKDMLNITKKVQQTCQHVRSNCN